MADFTAIDVETANADLRSICQVGVVRFRSGNLVQTWETLVNPVDYFDGINIAIHGIDEESVQEAPQFSDIYEELKTYLDDEIVVCHTAFDRISLTRAAQRYSLAEFGCRWLDTAKVVRRAWPEFAYRGYGLSNVANTLAIVFDHHDAKEDARAAGEILLRAVTATGLTIEQWLDRVNLPLSDIPRRERCRTSLDGDPNGPLIGEVAVFTGALSIPRHQAAELAARAGCNVESSVTKRTTLLIVGDQDLRKLSGHERSSKHRKAEQLIAKGYPIRILGESDFQRLVIS
jgi:DNA polymerase-3 subunit epsilon